MLKQLSQEIDNDQIDAAFDLIDEDKSNSVEFDELNSYFSKVNGIPQHLNKPQEKPVSSPSFFEKLLNQFSGHNQPPQGGMNSYGGGYYPQQGYPPQQAYGGYQQQHNPYMQQQYPQQPGMMGNPIFNQLSQGMNQSNSQNGQGKNGWGNGW